jgi:hypothetical protein
MQISPDITQYGAIAVIAVVFLERSLSFALRVVRRRTSDTNEALMKAVDEIRTDVRATRKGVWALARRSTLRSDYSNEVRDGSGIK